MLPAHVGPQIVRVARGGASNPLYAALGSALKYHAQVPLASSPLITLNSGNAAQLNDRVPGSTSHLVQAIAGEQPAHSDTSGLNGRPGLTLQSGARRMLASVAIAAGHRNALYLVGRQETPTHAVLFQTRGPLGAVYYSSGFVVSGAHRHRAFTRFTFGAQDPVISTPAYSATTKLFAHRPLATGAVAEIDNVAVSANYSGGDTVAAIDQIWIGDQAGAQSAGIFCFCALVDLSSDAAARHAIVLAYINSEYGTSY